MYFPLFLFKHYSLLYQEVLRNPALLFLLSERKWYRVYKSNSKDCEGCPYDNAVAEATYKIIKTEFAFNRIFNDFEELERELFDYVNWYNNIRIHGSLGYKTPIEYRAFS